MHFPLRALLLAALLLGSASWTTAADTAADDKKALLEFKKTFDNGDDVLTKWTDKTDPCADKWEGVACTDDRVTNITLNCGYEESYDEEADASTCTTLQGVVPDAGWKLPAELKVLDLLGNEISGVLPADWTWLPSNVSVINLGENMLSGTIPTADLPANLTELHLAYNSLTGTIPSNLSWVPASVQMLDVSSNLLSGSIPSGWELPNLVMAGFYDNELAGALPYICTNEDAEVVVVLGDGEEESNTFCGDIPKSPKFMSFTEDDGPAPLEKLGKCDAKVTVPKAPECFTS